MEVNNVENSANVELLLKGKFKSLNSSISIDLPPFSIMVGINGAGKTHLLTGLMGGGINLRQGNNELLPRRYIPAQQLTPNDSTPITSAQLKQPVDELWKKYNRHLKKFGHGAFKLPSIPDLDKLGNRILDHIVAESNKRIEDLTQNDFHLHYPLDDEYSRVEFFHQNFSIIFKRYSDKFLDNKFSKFLNESEGQKDKNFLGDKEFIQKYGEPPWNFVNNIFQELEIDYQVNSPNWTDKDMAFSLKLINESRKAEIQFSELSSGEKTLMSLALALYKSDKNPAFPKVLLMDEPDSSLHPSMTKKFLDIIQNLFIKKLNMIVIMTTHSPSTVALAPEESLFVVNKSEPRIKKTTKDQALRELTVGVPSFSVNYENRRQVFVESPNDVQYYEKLYRKLSNHLTSEISLNFISSGESKTDKNGQPVANSGQVINITTTLRGAGNKFIWGVIDWDLVNTSLEGVIVLGNGARYAIENYLLDPILLSALLFREKILTREDLNFTNNESYSDFDHLGSDKLQEITNLILQKVAPYAKADDKTLITTSLLNGSKLQIPNWYLHHHGHELEEAILKAFPELGKIKRGKEGYLKLEIIDKIIDDIPDLLSRDILDLFHELQKS